MPLDPVELENRFKFHPADTPEKQSAHEQVRATCLNTALTLAALTPPSREQSTAMRKLEEVMMWANAAIARNDTPAESA